jgi:hypothetical protein
VLVTVVVAIAVALSRQIGPPYRADDKADFLAVERAFDERSSVWPRVHIDEVENLRRAPRCIAVVPSGPPARDVSVRFLAGIVMPDGS